MNIPRRHKRIERLRMRRQHKATMARVVAVWLAKEQKKAQRGLKQGPDGNFYWTGR